MKTLNFIHSFFSFLLIFLLFSGFINNTSGQTQLRNEGGAPPTSYAFPQVDLVTISLQGDWRFAIDPKDEGERLNYYLTSFNDSSWQVIKAPDAWENQGITQKIGKFANGDYPYDGVGWYRKSLLIPAAWEGYDLELNLGVVDDDCKVFLNGSAVGEKHGFESSAVFRISVGQVKPGVENLLVVKVVDFGGEGGLKGGAFYIRPLTPWKEVALSIIPPSEGSFIYLPDQSIAMDLVTSNPLSQQISVNLKIEVIDYDGKRPGSMIHDVTVPAKGVIHMPFKLPPQPIGLYTIKLSLSSGTLVIAEKEGHFAVVKQPVKFSHPEKSPFALCGGSLFHIPLDQHKTLGQVRLRSHYLAGALWGRNDLWWGLIEPKKGVWNWSKADSTVDLFEKNGISLLGILSYFSAWSGDKAPRNDGEIEEFANYVRKIVARYKGRITYWEVWNEPNLGQFWAPIPNPGIYAKLLKRTYEVAKEVNPDCKIIGMVTSGTDMNFIKQVLDYNGNIPYMDIISIHPYHGWPPTTLRPDLELGKIPALRSMLNQHALGSLPIWITECGWQTIPTITLETHARYIVQLYVTQLEQDLVQRIYWFNLDDWQETGSSLHGQFGLFFNDQSPKPAFLAYRTMVDLLHDYQKAARIDESATPGLWHYVFTMPGDKKVHIYWFADQSSISGQAVKTPVEIKPPAGTTTIMDMYGCSTPIKSPPLKIPIALNPVYIY